ncbi:MAG: putative iclR family transcriptional regulator [Actinomycetia bacterium]|jgi:DNA-binding IclR family transcriptional regulator|nr:putative iclR family transcriptional regulator [Actinomycetes bacterium]MDQ1458571.1 IclR family transcriptional regulator, regulon repressor [Actinomycetota bacterium]
MAGGTVQSVDRAFAVLRQVASEPGGISEVARAVDLPVSTVARLLGTLESLGAVVRIGDSGTYGIGSGIRTLAEGVSASETLIARARPLLTELVGRTGETSGLSVLDGDEVVYLDHVESENEVTLRDWTGARLPLHVVSSGLVLLAAQPASVVTAYLAHPPARFTRHTMTQPARIKRRLATIRREGHAWTIGEFDEGISSVAAPVVDAHGTTVAAIHCHGPSYRFPGRATADTIASRVTAIARELGALLP